jgi:hypothetical protein
MRHSPGGHTVTINHDGIAANAAALSEEQQELDFRASIEAHQDWKLRLQAAVEGRCDDALDPHLVGRDDQCPLGRWIAEKGMRHFGGQRKFEDLRAKHAYFHVCAGRILSLAQAGRKDAALVELGPTGEFARLSRDVTSDLAALFLRLKGASA